MQPMELLEALQGSACDLEAPDLLLPLLQLPSRPLQLAVEVEVQPLHPATAKRAASLT